MGGVGSGKSSVLDYLQNKYNACVIKSDDVAKEIMNQKGPISKKVLELFPEADARGRINREKLAQIVFGNQKKLQQLNAVTHPATISQIITEVEQSKSRITVLESALMIGSGLEKYCDELWFIYCDRKERIRRLQVSRGYSVQKAEDIINSQPDDEEYHQLADEVIDNSKKIEYTYEQIDYILSGSECE